MSNKMVVVKTLRVEPYHAVSIVDGFKSLGKYVRYSEWTRSEATHMINGTEGKEVFSLEKPIDVHFIKGFVGLESIVRGYKVDEWMKNNGFEPMQLQHAFAIGLQYPEEQKSYPIWTLGFAYNGMCFVAGTGLNMPRRLVEEEPQQRVCSLIKRFSFSGLQNALFGAVRMSAK